MLFKAGMWRAILDGTKTQTRRLVKPREVSRDGYKTVAKSWVHVVLGITGHRAWVPYYPKWQVGRTYAIQPGRGKPAIWLGPGGTPYDTPLAEYLRKAESGTRALWGPRVKRWLHEHGYREARIRITAIRKERLQEISCGGYVYRSDIQQEGCPFVNDPNQMGLDEVEWFIELWDSINAKNGDRWADNPEVWVLDFRCVSTPKER